MKKVMLLLLALLLISTSAFAAAVACTRTEYGYTCTGGTTAGLVVADTWLTSTAYVVGQKVTNGGKVYVCQKDHTSGTFATDQTNGKWNSGVTAVLYVTMMNFYPVGAGTDTATFTSGASNQNAGYLAQYNANLSFPNGGPYGTSSETGGTPLTNLKVAMTASSDILNIYISRDNFSTPSNM
ncbi:MAG: hypothetical protein WCP55_18590 [Lentisphaerota bacterium]